MARSQAPLNITVLSGGPDAEGFNASASFILGGQVKGQASELYLIYPEGNHITATRI